MTENNKKGFTLVEGLVAIAILVLVISSVMNVIHSGFKPLTHSRAQMTATLLAQEAVETVRNIRDINHSEGEDWLFGLYECLDLCRVSVISSPVISACPGGSCDTLRYDTNTGRYGYEAGWTESEFTREVRITEETLFRVLVSVRVSWPTGEMVMKETLYNFQ